MRRASYREAIAWIAGNDDTAFMDEEPGSACASLSVTGALIVDLFGVEEGKFRKDLRRALDLLERDAPNRYAMRRTS